MTAARRFGGFFLTLMTAWPTLAQAQQPPAPLPRPPATEHGVADDTYAEAQAVGSHWERGRPRWFLATTIDAGYLYFRPRGSAGYGLPHAAWVGLDANPLVSAEGLGAYAGLRFALPNIDLRIGGRYFYTFSRSLLEPQDSFDRVDLDTRTGPKSKYLSLEAELTGSLPLGPGRLFAVLTGTSVLLVPDGYFVFEEQMKVVIDPPYIWRTRLGYEGHFGPHGAFGVGAVAELVGNPGRDAIVLRGGIISSLRLGPHVELRGTLVPVIVSRDALVAAGAEWFEFGVRYRDATE